MRNFMISFVAFGALLLGGCQNNGMARPDPSAATPATEATKPALSAEARQALAKAETDVKEAKTKKALWTTAEGALKKAKEAAAKGDSAATLKFSKIASDQAHLGMKQLNYPSTK
ncbi:MAG: hypothetical protein AUK53_00550 [Betaproteobacteria bacterium CG2_30_59_46]|nr:MAG: hypothetical protein AUK53_00550 [Betaproteobacteria bacterium CG2_30_59_46]PIQ14100.1 MAG: hypothetical protein COW70_01060 [Hydrogenophilales bacterium CG18_big_fil_WC_8_21_14_2_50_58_12]PIX98510.1 MAG: hypothetical protein COZ23_14060 [Hydrogenophilales bacterium CG_4_10_14_3_um_filter_58_23]PJB06810.1 MAG: hypothetical protein CO125_06285 [Hydrogenophilales bacterium CG_4_9_14_3_um_filter_59_35]